MLKRFYDKIPPIFKNKYLLTGVAFLLLMFLFDRNNLVTQYQLRKELKGLRNELKFYRDEAYKDSVELSRLMGDSLELEKLGREKYMMKRDSEDVYIIVRKTAAKQE